VREELSRVVLSVTAEDFFLGGHLRARAHLIWILLLAVGLNYSNGHLEGEYSRVKVKMG